MLISIIIPTYNRANLITRAIKSVLNQTNSEWELLIVDDGSTDDTERVVARFQADPRIKYFKKDNSGAPATRNFGVANASGEIITFLDSDDEAVDYWLAQMVDPFFDGEVGVVCCGCTYYNTDGVVMKTSLPRNLGPAFFNYKGRFTNGGVFALRKEIFLRIGGFDTKLKSSQNTELALRLTPYLNENNLKVDSLDEALIKVHIHEGPRIRYNYNGVFEGSTQVFSKYISRFELDRVLYINWIRTIVYNGLKLNKHRELHPYIKLLFKTAGMSYKSWYYLAKWLASYPRAIRTK